MSRREAFLLPGGQNGPHAPLLMLTGDAAERRGALRTTVCWDDPDRPLSLDPAERGPWVAEQLRRAVPDLPEGAVLIGKSLGAYAASVAAREALPAIWLTPVMTSDWVVNALRGSTAPFLLIGGTADPLWDSALAHRLTEHVLEVDGADHGMYVTGPLTATTTVWGQVAAAAEYFFDDVVWP